jgi:hypothetical protein
MILISLNHAKRRQISPEGAVINGRYPRRWKG